MTLTRGSSAHVSRNRLEGSLEDAPLTTLLDGCKRHLITGTIRIKAKGKEGKVLLRAGVMDEADWGEARGEDALQQMCKLKDGMYYLAQRLPDLEGGMGDAAQCDGDLADISLIKMMRHCEDEALSCTITVISEFDRAEISYRVGEIASVTLNGQPGEDAIGDIVNYKDGKFRVSTPPLPSDIEGWPTVSGEPTAPFKIAEATAKKQPDQLLNQPESEEAEKSEEEEKEEKPEKEAEKQPLSEKEREEKEPEKRKSLSPKPSKPPRTKPSSCLAQIVVFTLGLAASILCVWCVHNYL